MSLHSDIVVPYLYSFGTDEQKQRWLAGCASGELVTALGMTEPGTGSDLAALATTAVRDGDDYVINGSKTFISNGQLCDIVVVAAKTDPDPANAHKGISLFVVEAGRKGFTKGKKLQKMGMASQDTSRAVLRGLPGPGRQPARARGRRLHDDDAEAPAGAAVRGDRRGRRRRAGAGGHDRVHQGAQGVRQADQQVPEHPVQAGRVPGQGRGRPGLRRQGDRRARRRQVPGQGVLDRQVLDHRHGARR